MEVLCGAGSLLERALQEELEDSCRQEGQDTGRKLWVQTPRVPLPLGQASPLPEPQPSEEKMQKMILSFYPSCKDEMRADMSENYKMTFLFSEQNSLCSQQVPLDVVTDEDKAWPGPPESRTGQRDHALVWSLPLTAPSSPGSNQEAVISRRTASHPLARVSEPCPGGLSLWGQRHCPSHTMAGLLCLVLLSTSLAGLLLPGGSGKYPSPYIRGDPCKGEGEGW